MEINGIVASIHHTGKMLAACIEKNELNQVAAWYAQRQTAISELVNCYPALIEKETLKKYLREFSAEDQKMITKLSAEREELQKTLKSFQQLRHYVSV